MIIEGSEAVASANDDEARHGELLVRARELNDGKRAFPLRLRAYDQGAAYRLEIPAEPREGEIRLSSETTALRFPRDYACLAVRHSKYLNSHEGDYAPVAASALKAGALYDLPLACTTGRGVKLWLWTNWDAIGRDMDHVFALYEQWGIAGIKVDYVYRQDQIAIGYYHRLLAAAARHHLMVNFHGAPVPRGLERTYPNLMTEEGVMGAEYSKWSRSVTAGYNVRLAYTRAAVGPMDYTPGGFRNTTPAAFFVRHTLPQVMTTRAQQLALFVVYPSPLQSLADAPSAYIDAAGHLAPGSVFLRIVPAAWDETRGIGGAWGRWIAVARRSGSRWFVGIMGDEHGRTVTIPFDFLSHGEWRVRAWVDGATPTDVAGHGGTIEAGTHLRVPLAPSGGAVLVLDPA
jgi:alpha-glucosidase